MEIFATFARIAALALALGLCALPAVHAEEPVPLAQQVRTLALDAAKRDEQAGGSPARIEVVVGELDPRLHLAPCQKVEPYLPSGARLWGRSRVGLRCVDGTARWNVTLPVQVKVFAQALVAKTALAVGSVVAETDLAQAEVDLAEDASAALHDPAAVIGRSLARALNPGQAVRVSHLKTRQWFAAGDTVQVTATGGGFRVAGEGVALTVGIEGMPARVRTEGGRILTGNPVGLRAMEVSL